jgi:hypothetical protein
MAGHGVAGQGAERQGRVWQGKAWQGWAGQGTTGLGRAWSGGAGHGKARQGMATIPGENFHIRGMLKGLGGKWDPAKKCWIVPDKVADEARRLVAGGAAIVPGLSQKAWDARKKCAKCGQRLDMSEVWQDIRYCPRCK